MILLNGREPCPLGLCLHDSVRTLKPLTQGRITAGRLRLKVTPLRYVRLISGQNLAYEPGFNIKHAFWVHFFMFLRNSYCFWTKYGHVLENSSTTVRYAYFGSKPRV